MTPRALAALLAACASVQNHLPIAEAGKAEAPPPASKGAPTVLPTVAEYLKAHPGRVVLTMAGIAIAISETAAATLVMHGAAAECENCGCYHLAQNYLQLVAAGQAILDVSELNVGSVEISDATRDLLAKATGHAPADLKIIDRPYPKKPTPENVKMAGMAARSDIDTRHTIRKADWYKRTRVDVAFSLPHWVYQRETSVAGEGWIEERQLWVVHPNGDIESDVRDGLSADTVMVDIRRSHELDGAVPLRAIQPKHRAFVAIYRFASGYYLQPNPELPTA